MAAAAGIDGATCSPAGGRHRKHQQQRCIHSSGNGRCSPGAAPAGAGYTAGEDPRGLNTCLAAARRAWTRAAAPRTRPCLPACLWIHRSPSTLPSLQSSEDPEAEGQATALAAELAEQGALRAYGKAAQVSRSLVGWRLGRAGRLCRGAPSPLSTCTPPLRITDAAVRPLLAPLNLHRCPSVHTPCKSSASTRSSQSSCWRPQTARSAACATCCRCAAATEGGLVGRWGAADGSCTGGAVRQCGQAGACSAPFWCVGGRDGVWQERLVSPSSLPCSRPSAVRRPRNVQGSYLVGLTAAYFAQVVDLSQLVQVGVGSSIFQHIGKCRCYDAVPNPAAA